MAVRFRMLDVTPVPLEVADGMALYAGALGGADVIHRPTVVGTEDYVAFERKPQTESVRYRIDVSSVPGLRLVENELEFVDEEGFLRLRMAPPKLVDARGIWVAAKTSLEGCDYDPVGMEPAGRPITAPGAAECEVVIEWNDKNVQYPALLAPIWSTTAYMFDMRTGHQTVLAESPQPRVYAIGGNNGAAYLSTMEVYYAKQAVWATLPSMSKARSNFAATARENGGMISILVGGDSTTAVESYNSGIWAPRGSMATARRSPALFEHQGYYYAVGGCTSSGAGIASIERATIGAVVWSNFMFSLSAGRCAFAFAESGDIALVAGGRSGSTYYTAVEGFTDNTIVWGTRGNLSLARSGAAAVIASTAGIGSKYLVVAGRYNGSPRGNVDYFRISSWSRTTSPAFSYGLTGHTLSTHGPDLAVVGGRRGGAYPNFDYAEVVSLYDFSGGPGAGSWTSHPFIQRYGHTANKLNDDSLLVTGGTHSGADTYDTSVVIGAPEGAPCNEDTDCFRSHCVDDVCCDVACTSICMACSQAKNGSGADGVCGNVISGADPDGDCADMPASTCGTTGVCNGSGACAQHPAALRCDPKHCVANVLTWVRVQRLRRLRELDSELRRIRLPGRRELPHQLRQRLSVHVHALLLRNRLHG